MEHMKPIGLLRLDGNIAENWRKWKQRWVLYAKPVEQIPKLRKLNARSSYTQSGKRLSKCMIPSPSQRQRRIR